MMRFQRDRVPWRPPTSSRIDSASVGQRSTQSSQRMQRSSWITSALAGFRVGVTPTPVDVLDGDDADAVLGADVDAATTQDAERRLEHDVQEALKAARCLGTRLLLRVAELDLGRADAAFGRLGRARRRARWPCSRPAGRFTSMIGSSVRPRRRRSRRLDAGDLHVDRCRGPASVPDRVDQVPRAEGDVAAGVDARPPRWRASRGRSRSGRAAMISTPSSGSSHDRSGAWPIARITESHSIDPLGALDEPRVEPAVRVEDR